MILKPQDEWKRADTQGGIRDVREKAVKAAVPGVSIEVSQPIEKRMDDLLQGVRSDVPLMFYEPDLKTLTDLANQSVTILRGIDGAGDVQAEQLAGLPALTIQVDRQKLSRYGLNAADALAVVQSIGGMQVGTVYGDDNSQTPIVVRLPREARTDANRIAALPVGLANGLSVLRDGLRRRIDVDINLDGRNSTNYVADAL